MFLLPRPLPPKTPLSTPEFSMCQPRDRERTTCLRSNCALLCLTRQLVFIERLPCPLRLFPSLRDKDLSLLLSSLISSLYTQTRADVRSIFGTGFVLDLNRSTSSVYTSWRVSKSYLLTRAGRSPSGDTWLSLGLLGRGSRTGKWWWWWWCVCVCVHTQFCVHNTRSHKNLRTN